MAEFIQLVNDDLSLPLPADAAICLDNLRYTYEDCHRTIILYQGGNKGELLHVSSGGSLIFPDWIIKHMGLSSGHRFYYIYSPQHRNVPIRIKNDHACIRCGDYSVPLHELISLFGERRGVCLACAQAIVSELLFSDDPFDTYKN